MVRKLIISYSVEICLNYLCFDSQLEGFAIISFSTNSFF